MFVSLIKEIHNHTYNTSDILKTMNLDLKNKNAMICGATAGIGKATATELAAM